MNNKRILNYSMVTAYTIIFVLVAVIIELALYKVSAPTGLVRIGEGLAETGFSVTVIAVSILAVITNISEKRFFGIKAGEYLKFRHRKFSPGFYDVLIIIVLIGALQYAALAAEARFAAAVMFVQIIALMIVQVRSGLGIAFFYYGKEKAIRAFFVGEIKENLAVIANEKAGGRRKDRAALAVSSRIDNLFTHTKNAASVRQSAEIQQNLNMMAYILGLFLDSKYQIVWHNFETRMDYLISSLIQDEEQREYAISSLLKMMDVILAARNSDNKTIAKNCDFDQSRNSVYNMVTYAQTKILQEMIDKQIFYKLALVKIYGISDIDRKAVRYALYTDQLAELIAQSKHLLEVTEMIEGSIKKLVPVCFVDGKSTETAIYTCLLIKALKKSGVSLNGLWGMQGEQEDDEQKQHSICMMKYVLDENSDLCTLSETEKNTVDDLKKLIADEK